MDVRAADRGQAVTSAACQTACASSEWQMSLCAPPRPVMFLMPLLLPRLDTLPVANLSPPPGGRIEMPAPLVRGPRIPCAPTAPNFGNSPGAANATCPATPAPSGYHFPVALSKTDWVASTGPR